MLLRISGSLIWSLHFAVLQEIVMEGEEIPL